MIRGRVHFAALPPDRPARSRCVLPRFILRGTKHYCWPACALCVTRTHLSSCNQIVITKSLRVCARNAVVSQARQWMSSGDCAVDNSVEDEDNIAAHQSTARSAPGAVRPSNNDRWPAWPFPRSEQTTHAQRRFHLKEPAVVTAKTHSTSSIPLALHFASMRFAFSATAQTLCSALLAAHRRVVACASW